MTAEALSPIELPHLEDLVEILLPAVHSAVYWACLRHQYYGDEIEDLCQHTLLLLIEDDRRRWRSFDGRRSSLSTWLQAVVDHLVSNFLQRRKTPESWEALSPDALTLSPTQEEETIAAERRDWMREASGRLSARERQIFWLSYVEDLGDAEVASVMQLKVDSVYRYKHAVAEKLWSYARVCEGEGRIDEKIRAEASRFGPRLCIYV